MEKVFIILLAVAFAVAVAVLSAVVRKLKKSLRQVNQDVALLSQRIDYLRREMSKTTSGMSGAMDNRIPDPFPQFQSAPPAAEELPAPKSKPVVPYPPQVPADFMKIEFSKEISMPDSAESGAGFVGRIRGLLSAGSASELWFVSVSAAVLVGLAVWLVPIRSGTEYLTILLSFLAYAVLWYGHRTGRPVLIFAAYGIYLAVFVKLVGYDLLVNFAGYDGGSVPLAAYWSQMAGRLWRFGLPMVSVACAFRLQAGLPGGMGVALSPAATVGAGLSQRVLYWYGVLFSFLFVNFELNALAGHWPLLRQPVLTIALCGMAGYFLIRYIRGELRNMVVAGVMMIFLMAALLKLFTLDMRHMTAGYRVIACAVTGTLISCGAFAYVRARRLVVKGGDR